ncbi:hypothetical protein I316_02024 [Kwoniella heveanensis BCC8398]|uniref:Uncharacterized protein n=1 Tax=Kwoniella heveanensis BCC8398 TaxID=1296120 RepID=A0A1B9GYR7_9TREE|nr:hypothetical protein I316_02024 [Kwoniella heveanensis BCC8398]
MIVIRPQAEAEGEAFADDETRINTLDRGHVHPYHRQGDIALRSSEGTILRADSWRLASASTVFTDMFEIPLPLPSQSITDSLTPSSSTSTTSTKDKSLHLDLRPKEGSPEIRLHTHPQTIDLDYPTIALDYFLNLINVSRPSIPPGEFHHTLHLLDLCLTFDIKSSIEELVTCRLLHQSHGRQWKLLIWASQKNYVSIAKEALKRMSKEIFLSYGKSDDFGVSPSGPCPPSLQSRLSDTPVLVGRPISLSGPCSQLPWHALSKLQPLWEIKLLRSVLRPVEYEYEDSRVRVPDVLGITDNWTRVAKNFNP